MFYTNEMIKNIGYENKEQFIDDYITKYKNCIIRFADNGAYVISDWSTSPAMENLGYWKYEPDIKLTLKQKIGALFSKCINVVLHGK